MNINADYHTHTKYSHGLGTPEQNVLAAMERGLKRITITDHGPKCVFFGVTMEKLRAIRREIDTLNKRFGNSITVLMGIECNLIGDGICDLPEDPSIFDMVLLGYHRAVWPRDGMMWRFGLAALFSALADKVRASLAILKALERYPIDIISHPGEYLPVDIKTLASGAAQLGVALEINEKHSTMDERQIHIAAEQGARFVVSSDAHDPRNVGLVGRALALAERSGVLDRVVNLATPLTGSRLRFEF
ncbi:MAG: PHP domain-containing protein [Bacillota bacterium]